MQRTLTSLYQTIMAHYPRDYLTEPSIFVDRPNLSSNNRKVSVMLQLVFIVIPVRTAASCPLKKIQLES